MIPRIISYAMSAAFAWSLTGCVAATQGSLQRTAAQDLSCDREKVSVYTGHRTGNASGCGRTARYEEICENRLYPWDLPVCRWVMMDAPISVASNPPPKQRRKALSNSKDAPKEALGFVFGSSSSAAKEICLQAGHEYVQSQENKNQFLCTGAPRSPGVPTKTALSFCQGELCGVVALADFKPNTRGNKNLTEVLTALTQKYGAPNQSKTRLTRGCEGSLAECIHSGKGVWDARWSWTKDRHVHVAAKKHLNTVRLRAEYQMGLDGRFQTSRAPQAPVDSEAF